MEPLPSVLLFQVCNILIKAHVVLEFGIVPNFFLSILANIAAFKCSSTTNSSATFEPTGVSDIGRRWSFTSVIGFFFGMDIEGCPILSNRHGSYDSRNSPNITSRSDPYDLPKLTSGVDPYDLAN